MSVESFSSSRIFEIILDSTEASANASQNSEPPSAAFAAVGQNNNVNGTRMADS